MNDYPACWDWPIPHIADPSWDDYQAFHGGRCAICAIPAGERLVRDHCHSSGLHRGMLCYSCNTSEGNSSAAIFRRYRLVCSARLLGFVCEYSPGDAYGDGLLPLVPYTLEAAIAVGDLALGDDPPDDTAPFWRGMTFECIPPRQRELLELCGCVGRARLVLSQLA